MSLQDIEIASEYQALDTAAAADGSYLHAHVLRSLARSTNYLVAGKGHELLTLIFDARVGGAPADPAFPALVDCVGGLSWGRMLAGRWTRPKLPRLNRMDVAIQARITPANASVLVQVETLHSVLDLNTNGPSGQVFGLAGPASYPDANATTTYWLRNVPIDEGPLERLGFWIRGLPTNVAGDVATRTSGGTGVAAGYVASMSIDGKNAVMQSTGGSLVGWNTDTVRPRVEVDYYTGFGGTLNVYPHTTASSNYSWATDNYLMIHNGPSPTSFGRTLYQAQIVAVSDVDTVHLYPPPPDTFPGNYVNCPWAIFKLPTVQIVSISCFANWRTT